MEAFPATSRDKDPDSALVTATKCGDMYASSNWLPATNGERLPRHNG